MTWSFNPAGLIDGIVRIVLLVILGLFMNVPYWAYWFLIFISEPIFTRAE